MKTIYIKLSLLLLAFCMTVGVSGQSLDQRLWGEWTLESMEQIPITNGVLQASQSYLATNILKQRSNFPEDLFMLLYMFGTNIGVSSSNNDFENLQINDKGSFYTDNGHLIVTMNRESLVTMDFTYSINGDKLTLLTDVQSKRNPAIKYRRNLVYILTHKDN